MKDLLVLSTVQSVLHSVQSSLTEEQVGRVVMHCCTDLHGIVDFIENKLPSSVEVIVTMPGISFFLEQFIKKKMPVITVEYNNIDIIKTLNLALSVCPGRIAYGHYLHENQRLDDIRQLVTGEFDNFLFGNDDSTNTSILKKLHQRGVQAIVGGGYVCNLAGEAGLLNFPVQINKFTVKDTIRKALVIADTQKYTRYSQSNIDIILNNQAEAVITVDAHNKITFFNKSAKTLFGVDNSAVTGKPSAKLFPGNHFQSVLDTGASIETEPHTVQGIGMVGSYRPVFDNNKVIGAVGTFNTMADIQKKDEFVRKYLAPAKSQAKHFFDDFFDRGAVFQNVLEKARCFARTNETVLITGESGTGKEVMAGSLHNASSRRGKPFLSINSAAIPATLMESELFGYEPGAFTGGKKEGSPGLFEFTHGGTLFLDEIGEMPLELQAKLLRVIQEKEVRRIGASRAIPVDVRLIAATNKDLRNEAATNRFRADLYYRLNILHVHMPALRDDAEHIEDIAAKMLLKLSPDAKQHHMAHLRTLLAQVGTYAWPGNLRELENIVRRYMALGPYLGRQITLTDIFEATLVMAVPRSPDANIDTQAREHILTTYQRLHCNKTLTARELGISRSTLWRKLKQINSHMVKDRSNDEVCTMQTKRETPS